MPILFIVRVFQSCAVAAPYISPRVSVSCPVMGRKRPKKSIPYDDKVNAAALPPSSKHYLSRLDNRKITLRSPKKFTF